MSFVSKLIKNGNSPVSIIRCVNNSKEKIYFVILFKNKMSLEMLKQESKEKNKKIELTHFGKILIKGFGHVPNKKKQRILLQQYGIDYKQAFA